MEAVAKSDEPVSIGAEHHGYAQSHGKAARGRVNKALMMLI